MIKFITDPSDEEIVEDGQGKGGTNGEVGADVSENTNLGRQENIGHQKLANNGRKGTLDRPEVEWMEDHLTASVGVSGRVSELRARGT